MTGIAAWMIVGMASVAGIETPEYSVIEKSDGYEVREYAPHILAQVTVNGEFENSLNAGFRKVADYIFGNNTAKKSEGAGGAEKIAMTAPVIEQKAVSEKVAMTAPVIEQEKSVSERIVAFVMPKSYTLETLPAPNNPEIKLIEIPKKRYAALKFSGWVDEKKAVAKKRELAGALERNKLETVGEPMLAQYNPPWTPPFMRKNEILIELK